MKKKYKGLDGLRGITALIIAYIYHYKNEFNNCRPMINCKIGNCIDWLYEYGWLGVELFIYISGFVMYISYYEKISGGGGKIQVIYKAKNCAYMPTFLVNYIGCNGIAMV